MSDDTMSMIMQAYAAGQCGDRAKVEAVSGKSYIDSYYTTAFNGAINVWNCDMMEWCASKILNDVEYDKEHHRHYTVMDMYDNAMKHAMTTRRSIADLEWCEERGARGYGEALLRGFWGKAPIDIMAIQWALNRLITRKDGRDRYGELISWRTREWYLKDAIKFAKKRDSMEVAKIFEAALDKQLSNIYH